MAIQDLPFQATKRPDASLFYRRRDAKDRRLGDATQTALEAYAEADVVVLGCPHDEGVRRNGGRTGAALAPDAIRRALYRLTVNGLENLRLFDLGNTRVRPTLEAMHEVQRHIVYQVIKDGKTLIVLGGGNDLSYPDCAGLADAEPDVLAFNVDAHYDVRADAVRNSGTSYRQLLEESVIPPARLYETAGQPFANSPVYARYLQEKGAHVVGLKELRSGGVAASFERVLAAETAEVIFWGIDMDSVRAADAPGVSAPNPVGLAGDELCEIASVAGSDRRSRVFEVTEVNPSFDIDDRTSRLAAVAIWSFLAAREAAR